MDVLATDVDVARQALRCMGYPGLTEADQQLRVARSQWLSHVNFCLKHASRPVLIRDATTSMLHIERLLEILEKAIKANAVPQPELLPPLAEQARRLIELRAAFGNCEVE